MVTLVCRKEDRVMLGKSSGWAKLCPGVLYYIKVVPVDEGWVMRGHMQHVRQVSRVLKAY